MRWKPDRSELVPTRHGLQLRTTSVFSMTVESLSHSLLPPKRLIGTLSIELEFM